MKKLKQKQSRDENKIEQVRKKKTSLVIISESHILENHLNV